MSSLDEPSEFDLGCFFHGFEGDVTADNVPYVSCIECGHLYWTEGQLLSEFNAKGREAMERSNRVLREWEEPEEWIDEVNSDEIAFCAWCLHDF